VRETLTGLAILVIVALLAAIVAPHFIDWNGQRARIEAELGKIAGVPVRVDGDVSILLLPVPTLAAKAVTIGSADDDIAAVAEGLEARLDIGELLRGDVAISSLTLDRPLVTVDREAIDDDAERDLVVDPAALRRYSIAELRVTRGAVRFKDEASAPPAFQDIALTAEAVTLAGPFRGSGSVVVDGRPRTVRFNAGEMSREKIPLRLAIEDAAGGSRLEVDGAFHFVRGEDAKPRRFAGRFDGAGSIVAPQGDDSIPVLWRASGPIVATQRQLDFSSLSLSLGVAPAETSLRGEAFIDLRKNGPVRARLEARQIDLDALLGEGEPRRIAPLGLAGLMSGVVGRLADLNRLGEVDGRNVGEADIEFTSEAVILGGDRLSNVHLRLGGRANAIRIDTARADLPFGGAFSFDSDDSATTGEISGRLAMRVPEARLFAGWVTGARPQPAGPRSVELAGAVRIGEDGAVTIGDGAFVVDGVRFAGEAAYRPPVRPERPQGRIAARLATGRLSLESLAATMGGPEATDLPPIDVELAIEAIDYGGQSMEGVAMSVAAEGGRVDLRRMEIADLGGARISATGHRTAEGMELETRIEGDRLEAAVAAFERFSPNLLTRRLAAASSAFGPGAVDISIGSRWDQRSATSSTAVTVAGDLAGTRLAANGTWRGGATVEPSNLTILLEAADAVRLARQLGLPVDEAAANAPSGPAKLRFDAGGTIPTGFAITVRAEGVASSLDFDGVLTLASQTPLTGALTVGSYDVGRLAALAGLRTAFIAPGKPGRVTGRVLASTSKLTLTDMDTRFGEMAYGGEIAFDFLRGGSVKGQIRASEVDIAALLEIPFGDWPQAAPGETLPSRAFGPSERPVLNGDLWIEASQGRIRPDLVLSDPRFVLRFDKGFLAFEHVDARIAGGRITGDVTLRRVGDAVQASSSLKATDLDLERFGPPGLLARITGAVKASTIGASPKALVEALAGAGSFEIANLQAPGLDPGALQRVAASVERAGASSQAGRGAAGLEGLEPQLERELARAPLVLGSARIDLSIANGVARFAPVGAETRGALIAASGSLDLNEGVVNARLSMQTREPVGRSSIRPQAVLSWSGPLLSPTRRIDVGSLATAVTEEAIRIEQERSAIFEEDLKERAMFNRRLKADRAQIAFREAQIAAEREAERSRLEMERARLEAEAMRAYRAARGLPAERTPVAPISAPAAGGFSLGPALPPAAFQPPPAP
jgi:uncharacterized protein involved in outer membrane biogenesis